MFLKEVTVSNPNGKGGFVSGPCVLVYRIVHSRISLHLISSSDIALGLLQQLHFYHEPHGQKERHIIAVSYIFCY